jgi:hypothetical protein
MAKNPRKLKTDKPKNPRNSPPEVLILRKQIAVFLDTVIDGKTPCNARCGVYVFYDYDGEPIYIGQTNERLRVRILRHLTNQRTDAVAMNVLDPFEVAEIEVFPFYDLEMRPDEEKEKEKKKWKARVSPALAAAEFTVFTKVLAESGFHAVLNEKDIPQTAVCDLPQSFRAKIIPTELWEGRKHPDTRIARRAGTIANLARVISERQVSTGLRRTLVTQAKRLLHLAEERLKDFAKAFPEEHPGEETGEESE